MTVNEDFFTGIFNLYHSRSFRQLIFAERESNLIVIFLPAGRQDQKEVTKNMLSVDARTGTLADRNNAAALLNRFETRRGALETLLSDPDALGHVARDANARDLQDRLSGVVYGIAQEQQRFEAAEALLSEGA